MVSGDGTWKTRGHSSLVGVCTVIGAESGKVIDIDVTSSYCKSCEVSNKLYSDKSKSSYQQWQSHHANSCQKKHFGSEGKMEIEGIKKLFRRSVVERGVRYLSYIGDGDASTFKDVCEDKPYGINTTIEKAECVGHVQKRMGTRLRRLKKDMKRKIKFLKKVLEVGGSLIVQIEPAIVGFCSVNQLCSKMFQKFHLDLLTRHHL
ncbi:hypothetical protein AVEN_71593-1 [Araneus ventricosus]|uniref:Mutator-like transposase domain-containing protein n=1 Tax=Araneus ventricosus TaxID=182803 RepID=A0A4Y2MBT7_ARAVE|nr:hypothetical protein AVEN_71593-1 [Araneus ventricosus]